MHALKNQNRYHLASPRHTGEPAEQNWRLTFLARGDVSVRTSRRAMPSEKTVGAPPH
jgi:negative regulator of sigma E activity